MKFFTYLGIYWFCVKTHEYINSEFFAAQMGRLEQELESIGIYATKPKRKEEAKNNAKIVPMSRIGF